MGLNEGRNSSVKMEKSLKDFLFSFPFLRNVSFYRLDFGGPQKPPLTLKWFAARAVTPRDATINVQADKW